jgi:hypothetical protein
MIDAVDDASRPLVMTVQGAVRTMISEDTEWTPEEKVAIRHRVLEKANGFPTVSINVGLSQCCVSWLRWTDSPIGSTVRSILVILKRR